MLSKILSDVQSMSDMEVQLEQHQSSREASQSILCKAASAIVKDENKINTELTSSNASIARLSESENIKLRFDSQRGVIWLIKTAKNY